MDTDIYKDYIFQRH